LAGLCVFLCPMHDIVNGKTQPCCWCVASLLVCSCAGSVRSLTSNEYLITSAWQHPSSSRTIGGWRQGASGAAVVCAPPTPAPPPSQNTCGWLYSHNTQTHLALGGACYTPPNTSTQTKDTQPLSPLSLPVHVAPSTLRSPTTFMLAAHPDGWLTENATLFACTAKDISASSCLVSAACGDPTRPGQDAAGAVEARKHASCFCQHETSWPTGHKQCRKTTRGLCARRVLAQHHHPHPTPRPRWRVSPLSNLVAPGSVVNPRRDTDPGMTNASAFVDAHSASLGTPGRAL
jgi:hypothetical protein